jgi:hypothetical protein
MITTERRFITGAGLRARREDGETPGIAGVAAVYSQQYDTGWYIESISPGAFTRALAEQQDVRCLFNHDVNNLLARTKNGTLQLEDSTAGLKFDAVCDSTTSVGRDVPAMIARGDIDGCSFSFNVRKASWRDVYDANGNYEQSYRQIEDVDLFDVGPVTFPAYTATSVDVRTTAGVLERAKGLWPEGVPGDVRRHLLVVNLAVDGAAGQARGRRRPARNSAEPGYCSCDCAECMDGDCENCSHVDCDCSDCLCASAQGRALILRARAHIIAA